MFIKTSKPLLFAATILLTQGLAQNTLAADRHGFYFSATFGSAEYDIGLSDLADLNDGSNFTNASIDDSDTTFGLGFGYRISPYLAAEVGYSDFGEVDISAESDGTGFFWSPGPVTAAADTTGFTLGLKGVIPIQSNFEIYGRAGANRWDVDYDYADTSGVFSDSDDGTDAYFGIGASFLLQNISLGASFTRFDIADTDVDVIAAAIEVFVN